MISRVSRPSIVAGSFCGCRRRFLVLLLSSVMHEQPLGALHANAFITVSLHTASSRFLFSLTRTQGTSYCLVVSNRLSTVPRPSLHPIFSLLSFLPFLTLIPTPFYTPFLKPPLLIITAYTYISLPLTPCRNVKPPNHSSRPYQGDNTLSHDESPASH